MKSEKWRVEKVIRVLDIIEDTMVDGPGFRTSIYCAGCGHRCKGCHNPQSWDFGGGRAMTTQELMRIIMADPYANVTFSGGDPLYQAAGFAELAQAIHRESNKDIWCYTGFTYESLINDDQRELLASIDVLVDGPYIERLRDPDLLFRGSSNQRIIDVPATLFAGEVILWKPDVGVK